MPNTPETPETLNTSEIPNAPTSGATPVKMPWEKTQRELSQPPNVDISAPHAIIRYTPEGHPKMPWEKTQRELHEMEARRQPPTEGPWHEGEYDFDVRRTRTHTGIPTFQRKADMAKWYGPEHGNTGEPGWFNAEGKRMALNPEEAPPREMGTGEFFAKTALSNLKRIGAGVLRYQAGAQELAKGWKVPAFESAMPVAIQAGAAAMRNAFSKSSILNPENEKLAASHLEQQSIQEMTENRQKVGIDKKWSEVKGPANKLAWLTNHAAQAGGSVAPYANPLTPLLMGLERYGETAANIEREHPEMSEVDKDALASFVSIPDVALGLVPGVGAAKNAPAKLLPRLADYASGGARMGLAFLADRFSKQAIDEAIQKDPPHPGESLWNFTQRTWGEGGLDALAMGFAMHVVGKVPEEAANAIRTVWGVRDAKGNILNPGGKAVPTSEKIKSALDVPDHIRNLLFGSPEKRQAALEKAEMIRRETGAEPTLGEVTGDKKLKWIEEYSESVPFSGRAEQLEKQREAIKSAIEGKAEPFKPGEEFPSEGHAISAAVMYGLKKRKEAINPMYREVQSIIGEGNNIYRQNTINEYKKIIAEESNIRENGPRVKQLEEELNEYENGRSGKNYWGLIQLKRENQNMSYNLTNSDNLTLRQLSKYRSKIASAMRRDIYHTLRDNDPTGRALILQKTADVRWARDVVPFDPNAMTTGRNKWETNEAKLLLGDSGAEREIPNKILKGNSRSIAEYIKKALPDFGIDAFKYAMWKHVEDASKKTIEGETLIDPHRVRTEMGKLSNFFDVLYSEKDRQSIKDLDFSLSMLQRSAESVKAEKTGKWFRAGLGLMGIAHGFTNWHQLWVELGTIGLARFYNWKSGSKEGKEFFLKVREARKDPSKTGEAIDYLAKNIDSLKSFPAIGMKKPSPSLANQEPKGELGHMPGAEHGETEIPFRPHEKDWLFEARKRAPGEGPRPIPMQPGQPTLGYKPPEVPPEVPLGPQAMPGPSMVTSQSQVGMEPRPQQPTLPPHMPQPELGYKPPFPPEVKGPTGLPGPRMVTAQPQLGMQPHPPQPPAIGTERPPYPEGHLATAERPSRPLLTPSGEPVLDAQGNIVHEAGGPEHGARAMPGFVPREAVLERLSPGERRLKTVLERRQKAGTITAQEERALNRLYDKEAGHAIQKRSPKKKIPSVGKRRENEQGGRRGMGGGNQGETARKSEGKEKEKEVAHPRQEQLRRRRKQ